MSAYRLAVFGCTALLAVGAAACGDSSDDNGGKHHFLGLDARGFGG